jgi:hypothetical protein
MADFAEYQEQMLGMGAVELFDGSGQLPQYRLAAGWNRVDEAERVITARARDDMVRSLRGYSWGIRLADFALLAASAVAFALLVAGLLADIASRGERLMFANLGNAVPELRIVGAAAIFVASAAFVVYDGLLYNLSHSLSCVVWFWWISSGFFGVLSDCMLALIVLGAVAAVLILVLAALHRKISAIMSRVLFCLIAVLSLGSFIPAWIGVRSTFSDGSRDVAWHHSMNYNRSRSLRAYADAANAYHNTTLWRAPEANRSAGYTAWDMCGKPDSWFASLASAKPGDNDSLALGRLVILSVDMSIPGSSPPWDRDRDYSWESFPSFSDLYDDSHDITPCYGTAWDSESLQRASQKKDMCEMKLRSAADCFAGWDAGGYADYFCSNFTDCVSAFERSRELWEEIGAVNIAGPDERPQFRLPVGWNRLDDFIEAVTDHIISMTDREWMPSPEFWLAVHVPLLAIASVGWILLVVGLIAAVLRPPGELELREPSYQSVSDARLLTGDDQALARRPGLGGFNFS